MSFSIPRCRGWNGLLVAAGGAPSSGTQPSRGTPRFHPLPSLGDRGCRPLPCSPRLPDAVAADLQSATQRRDRPAASNAATAGAGPLARGQSDHLGAQSLSRRHPLIGTGTGGLRGHRNTVQPPRCSCLPRPRRVWSAPRCLIGDRHVVGARRLHGARAVGGPLGTRRAPRQACRRHRGEDPVGVAAVVEKERRRTRRKQVGTSSE